MKTIVLLSLLFSMGSYSYAQIYVDPATAGAMAAHSGVINNQLNKTNDNLTLIQRGQMAVTGQLLVANDLQAAIYKGLSEVSFVMRSLLAVKDIYEISDDIVIDINKATLLARDNPLLLLFAESGAREFKNRSVSLATEVSSFVLQGGKSNLMDSGERAKLLNRIVSELSILRGVAYGMYRSMYWAKQRGLLNALNPYSGFINIDNRIAEDILNNSKLIKK
ncbi:hypothetical protein [Pedobacter aquatilis]|uniref:hypothetical protein n=1 Tax=Pedobacter aquatilis TaxID=351343 RepID=UPI00292CE30A|nr:hypothetical protein [Pedobacter aquatilis]